jgi:hypothetical protein
VLKIIRDPFFIESPHGRGLDGSDGRTATLAIGETGAGFSQRQGNIDQGKLSRMFYFNKNSTSKLNVRIFLF